MGIVFSHAIAASLYYFRSLTRPAERNVQHPLLEVNDNKHDHTDNGLADSSRALRGYTYSADSPASLTEALMPVLDAGDLDELREAIKLTFSRIIVSASLIKVFLRDPLTCELVDENSHSVPTSRFISDILQQRGKTFQTVAANQDGIGELLGCHQINENNNSVLLLPVHERGSQKCICLVVVVLQAGSASNVHPNKLELCLKQISLTYELVKVNHNKNSEPDLSNVLSLIQLCGDLNDQDAAKLEVKVVRYLQEYTNSESGFLLLVVPETQMLYCQAIGNTVLQEEIRFAGPSSCFWHALENKQPMTLTDIPPDRRHEVEKIMRREIHSLLCVPICLTDSKDLLALACMVNKCNGEEFSTADIDTIHQCFKYTATVLTSTLAFQNERKLKNQTQALLQVAKKLFTRLGASVRESLLHVTDEVSNNSGLKTNDTGVSTCAGPEPPSDRNRDVGVRQYHRNRPQKTEPENSSWQENCKDIMSTPAGETCLYQNENENQCLWSLPRSSADVVNNFSQEMAKTAFVLLPLSVLQCGKHGNSSACDLNLEDQPGGGLQSQTDFPLRPVMPRDPYLTSETQGNDSENSDGYLTPGTSPSELLLVGSQDGQSTSLPQAGTDKATLNVVEDSVSLTNMPSNPVVPRKMRISEQERRNRLPASFSSYKETASDMPSENTDRKHRDSLPMRNLTVSPSEPAEAFAGFGDQPRRITEVPYITDHPASSDSSTEVFRKLEFMKVFFENLDEFGCICDVIEQGFGSQFKGVVQPKDVACLNMWSDVTAVELLHDISSSFDQEKIVMDDRLHRNVWKLSTSTDMFASNCQSRTGRDTQSTNLSDMYASNYQSRTGRDTQSTNLSDMYASNYQSRTGRDTQSTNLSDMYASNYQSRTGRDTQSTNSPDMYTSDYQSRTGRDRNSNKTASNCSNSKLDVHWKAKQDGSFMIARIAAPKDLGDNTDHIVHSEKHTAFCLDGQNSSCRDTNICDLMRHENSEDRHSSNLAENPSLCIANACSSDWTDVRVSDLVNQDGNDEDCLYDTGLTTDYVVDAESERTEAFYDIDMPENCGIDSVSNRTRDYLVTDIPENHDVNSLSNRTRDYLVTNTPENHDVNSLSKRTRDYLVTQPDDHVFNSISNRTRDYLVNDTPENHDVNSLSNGTRDYLVNDTPENHDVNSLSNGIRDYHVTQSDDHVIKSLTNRTRVYHDTQPENLDIGPITDRTRDYFVNDTQDSHVTDSVTNRIRDYIVTDIPDSHVTDSVTDRIRDYIVTDTPDSHVTDSGTERTRDGCVSFSQIQASVEISLMSSYNSEVDPSPATGICDHFTKLDISASETDSFCSLFDDFDSSGDYANGGSTDSDDVWFEASPNMLGSWAMTSGTNGQEIGSELCVPNKFKKPRGILGDTFTGRTVENICAFSSIDNDADAEKEDVTIPDKAPSVLKEDVNVSVKALSVMEEDVTIPEKALTVMEEHVAISDKAPYIVDKDVTIPVKIQFVMEEDVTVPDKASSVMEEDVTVPDKAPSIKEEDVTIPDKPPSVMEEDDTIPVKVPSVVEEDVTIPNKAPSINEEDVTVSDKAPSVLDNDVIIPVKFPSVREEDVTIPDSAPSIILVDVTNPVVALGSTSCIEKLSAGSVSNLESSGMTCASLDTTEYNTSILLTSDPHIVCNDDVMPSAYGAVQKSSGSEVKFSLAAVSMKDPEDSSSKIDKERMGSVMWDTVQCVVHDHHHYTNLEGNRHCCGESHVGRFDTSDLCSGRGSEAGHFDYVSSEIESTENNDNGSVLPGGVSQWSSRSSAGTGSEENHPLFVGLQTTNAPSSDDHPVLQEFDEHPVLLKVVDHQMLQEVDDHPVLQEIDDHVKLQEVDDYSVLQEVDYHSVLQEIDDPVMLQEIDEHVMLQEIDEHVMLQDIDDHVMLQEIDDHVMQEIDDHVMLQEIDEHVMLQEIDEHVMLQDIDDHVMLQEIDDHVMLQEIDDHVMLQEIDDHVMLQEIDDHVMLQEIDDHVMLQEVDYHSVLQEIDDHVMLQEVDYHSVLQEIDDHVMLQEIDDHPVLLEIDDHVMLLEIDDHVMLQEVKDHPVLQEVEDHPVLLEVDDHAVVQKTDDHPVLLEIDDHVMLQEVDEHPMLQEADDHILLQEFDDHPLLQGVDDHVMLQEFDDHPALLEVVEHPVLQEVDHPVLEEVGDHLVPQEFPESTLSEHQNHACIWGYKNSSCTNIQLHPHWKQAGGDAGIDSETCYSLFSIAAPASERELGRTVATISNAVLKCPYCTSSSSSACDMCGSSTLPMLDGWQTTDSSGNPENKSTHITLTSCACDGCRITDSCENPENEFSDATLLSGACVGYQTTGVQDHNITKDHTDGQIINVNKVHGCVRDEHIINEDDVQGRTSSDDHITNMDDVPGSISSDQITDVEDVQGSIGDDHIIDVGDVQGSIGDDHIIDVEDVPGSISDDHIIDVEDVPGSISDDHIIDVEDVQGSIGDDHIIDVEDVQSSIIDDHIIDVEDVQSSIIDDHIIDVEDVQSSISDDHIIDVEDIQSSISDDHIIDVEDVQSSISDDHIIHVKDVQGSISDDHVIDVKNVQGCISDDHIIDVEDVQSSISDDHIIDVEDVQSSISDDHIIHVEDVQGSISDDHIIDVEDVQGSISDDHVIDVKNVQGCISDDQINNMDDAPGSINNDRMIDVGDILSSISDDHIIIVKDVQGSVSEDHIIDGDDLRGHNLTEFHNTDLIVDAQDSSITDKHCDNQIIDSSIDVEDVQGCSFEENESGDLMIDYRVNMKDVHNGCVMFDYKTDVENAYNGVLVINHRTDVEDAYICDVAVDHGIGVEDAYNGDLVADGEDAYSGDLVADGEGAYSGDLVADGEDAYSGDLVTDGEDAYSGDHVTDGEDAYSGDLVANGEDAYSGDLVADEQDAYSGDLVADGEGAYSGHLIADGEGAYSGHLVADGEVAYIGDLVADGEVAYSGDCVADGEIAYNGDLVADGEDVYSDDRVTDGEGAYRGDLVANREDAYSGDLIADGEDACSGDLVANREDAYSGDLVADEQDAYSGDLVADREGAYSGDLVANGEYAYGDDLVADGEYAYSGDLVADGEYAYSGDLIAVGEDAYHGDLVGDGEEAYSGDLVVDGEDACSGDLVANGEDAYSGDLVANGEYACNGDFIADGEDAYSGDLVANGEYAYSGDLVANGEDAYRCDLVADGEVAYTCDLVADGEDAYSGDLVADGEGAYGCDPVADGEDAYSGNLVADGKDAYSGDLVADGQNAYSGDLVAEGEDAYRCDLVADGEDAYRGVLAGDGEDAYSGDLVADREDAYSCDHVADREDAYSGDLVADGEDAYSGALVADVEEYYSCDLLADYRSDLRCYPSGGQIVEFSLDVEDVSSSQVPEDHHSNHHIDYRMENEQFCCVDYICDLEDIQSTITESHSSHAVVDCSFDVHDVQGRNMEDDQDSDVILTCNIDVEVNCNSHLIVDYCVDIEDVHCAVAADCGDGREDVHCRDVADASTGNLTNSDSGEVDSAFLGHLSNYAQDGEGYLVSDSDISGYACSEEGEVNCIVAEDCKCALREDHNRDVTQDLDVRCGCDSQVTDDQAIDVEGCITDVTDGQIIDVEDHITNVTDDQAIVVKGHITNVTDDENDVEDHITIVTDDENDVEDHITIVTDDENDVEDHITIVTDDENDVEDHITIVTDDHVIVVEDYITDFTDDQIFDVKDHVINVTDDQVIDEEDLVTDVTDDQFIDLEDHIPNVTDDQVIDVEDHITDVTDDQVIDIEDHITDVTDDQVIDVEDHITDVTDDHIIDVEDHIPNVTDYQVIDIEDHIPNVTDYQVIDIEDHIPNVTDYQVIDIEDHIPNVTDDQVIDIEDHITDVTDDQVIDIEDHIPNVTDDQVIDIEDHVTDVTDDQVIDVEDHIPNVTDDQVIDIEDHITDVTDYQVIDVEDHITNVTDDQVIDVEDYITDVTDDQVIDIEDHITNVTDDQVIDIEDHIPNVTDDQVIDVDHITDVTDDHIIDVEDYITDVIDDQVIDVEDHIPNVTDDQVIDIEDHVTDVTDDQVIDIEDHIPNVTDDQVIDIEDHIPDVTDDQVIDIEDHITDVTDDQVIDIEDHITDVTDDQVIDVEDHITDVTDDHIIDVEDHTTDFTDDQVIDIVRGLIKGDEVYPVEGPFSDPAAVSDCKIPRGSNSISTEVLASDLRECRASSYLVEAIDFEYSVTGRIDNTTCLTEVRIDSLQYVSTDRMDNITGLTEDRVDSLQYVSTDKMDNITGLTEDRVDSLQYVSTDRMDNITGLTEDRVDSLQYVSTDRMDITGLTEDMIDNITGLTEAGIDSLQYVSTDQIDTITGLPEEVRFDSLQYVSTDRIDTTTGLTEDRVDSLQYVSTDRIDNITGLTEDMIDNITGLTEAGIDSLQYVSTDKIDTITGLPEEVRFDSLQYVSTDRIDTTTGLTEDRIDSLQDDKIDGIIGFTVTNTDSFQYDFRGMLQKDIVDFTDHHGEREACLETSGEISTLLDKTHCKYTAPEVMTETSSSCMKEDDYLPVPVGSWDECEPARGPQADVATEMTVCGNSLYGPDSTELFDAGSQNTHLQDLCFREAADDTQTVKKRMIAKTHSIAGILTESFMDKLHELASECILGDDSETTQRSSACDKDTDLTRLGDSSADATYFVESSLSSEDGAWDADISSFDSSCPPSESSYRARVREPLKYHMLAMRRKMARSQWDAAGTQAAFKLGGDGNSEFYASAEIDDDDVGTSAVNETEKIYCIEKFGILDVNEEGRAKRIGPSLRESMFVDVNPYIVNVEPDREHTSLLQMDNCSTFFSVQDVFGKSLTERLPLMTECLRATGEDSLVLPHCDSSYKRESFLEQDILTCSNQNQKECCLEQDILTCSNQNQKECCLEQDILTCSNKNQKECCLEQDILTCSNQNQKECCLEQDILTYSSSDQRESHLEKQIVTHYNPNLRECHLEKDIFTHYNPSQMEQRHLEQNILTHYSSDQRRECCLERDLWSSAVFRQENYEVLGCHQTDSPDGYMLLPTDISADKCAHLADTGLDNTSPNVGSQPHLLAFSQPLNTSSDYQSTSNLDNEFSQPLNTSSDYQSMRTINLDDAFSEANVSENPDSELSALGSEMCDVRLVCNVLIDEDSLKSASSEVHLECLNAAQTSLVDTDESSAWVSFEKKMYLSGEPEGFASEAYDVDMEFEHLVSDDVEVKYFRSGIGSVLLENEFTYEEKHPGEAFLMRSDKLSERPVVLSSLDIADVSFLHSEDDTRSQEDKTSYKRTDMPAYFNNRDTAVIEEMCSQSMEFGELDTRTLPLAPLEINYEPFLTRSSPLKSSSVNKSMLSVIMEESDESAEGLDLVDVDPHSSTCTDESLNTGISATDESLNAGILATDESLNAGIVATDESLNTGILATDESLNTGVLATNESLNTDILATDDSDHRAVCQQGSFDAGVMHETFEVYSGMDEESSCTNNNGNIHVNVPSPVGHQVSVAYSTCVEKVSLKEREDRLDHSESEDRFNQNKFSSCEIVDFSTHLDCPGMQCFMSTPQNEKETNWRQLQSVQSVVAVEGNIGTYETDQEIKYHERANLDFTDGLEDDQSLLEPCSCLQKQSRFLTGSQNCTSADTGDVYQDGSGSCGYLSIGRPTSIKISTPKDPFACPELESEASLFTQFRGPWNSTEESFKEEKCVGIDKMSVETDEMYVEADTPHATHHFVIGSYTQSDCGTDCRHLLKGSVTDLEHDCQGYQGYATSILGKVGGVGTCSSQVPTQTNDDGDPDHGHNGRTDVSANFINQVSSEGKCASTVEGKKLLDYLKGLDVRLLLSEDDVCDRQYSWVEEDESVVNEGVDDGNEDDLNASSEAYSDTMERLGSSDELLGGEDSGESYSDPDILNHTSSTINDISILQGLIGHTSDDLQQQEFSSQINLYETSKDTETLMPRVNSRSFSLTATNGCDKEEQSSVSLSPELSESYLEGVEFQDARFDSETIVYGNLHFITDVHRHGIEIGKTCDCSVRFPDNGCVEMCVEEKHREGCDPESVAEIYTGEDNEKHEGDDFNYMCSNNSFDDGGDDEDDDGGSGADTDDANRFESEDGSQKIRASIDDELQMEHLDILVNLNNNGNSEIVSDSEDDDSSMGLLGESDLCGPDDLFAVSSLSDSEVNSDRMSSDPFVTSSSLPAVSDSATTHQLSGHRERYHSFFIGNCEPDSSFNPILQYCREFSLYVNERKASVDDELQSEDLEEQILEDLNATDTAQFDQTYCGEYSLYVSQREVSDEVQINNEQHSEDFGEHILHDAAVTDIDHLDQTYCRDVFNEGILVDDCDEEDVDDLEFLSSHTRKRLVLECPNRDLCERFTFSDLVKLLPLRPVYWERFLITDDLTKLLREIMQEARNLTDAERCSVFLLDKDSDELVAMVFDGITADDKEWQYLDTVQGEIRLPKTQGIAGHVATTGKLLNIRDAYSHPLFYRGIDDSTGFRTRNILCFPIKDEEGVVFGVAQLCNKKTFQYFTTFDEDVASAFAVYCCISISHSLMYKKVIDIQYRNSLANELMMFHMKSLMYKKLVDTQYRHHLANALLLYSSNQQVPTEEVKLMAEMTIPEVTMFSPNFDSFDFPPRTIPESQTVLSCLSMFEDLGFLSRWRVKIDTLVRFLLMVKKGYRNPPYHNWMHAYAVTHFCYLLIKNLHLHNYLEDIELLALFVSCLCHDIDHRGTTNSFQVQSQSVLAALYSSEGSVMERHHLAQSMCILNTEGSNLFENLSSKEYQIVLDLMREIILATDLAHHLRAVKDQEKMAETGQYDKNNPTDKHNLLCLLMTACDLSDQTKSWHNTKHIASLVYQEFFSQGDLEKALGKNPLEMMDRERACIPELQISFLDNIATPVYKILANMFPEADIPLKNVEENRKHWVHIGQLLKLRHGTSTQAMSVEQIISIEEEEESVSAESQVNGR